MLDEGIRSYLISRASGFVTRSDIGPAIAATPDPLEQVLSGEVEDLESIDAGLLASTHFSSYDADDAEADRIYAAVETRMQERHAKKRKHVNTLASPMSSRSLKTEFGDLKRSISTISAQEWADIPEVGDLTAIGRAQRKQKLVVDDDSFSTSTASSSSLSRTATTERFTPAPDFLLERALSASSSSTISGMETDTTGTLTSPNFSVIGAVRERQLGLTIDTVSNGAMLKSGQETEAYMTGLMSMHQRSSTEVRDLTRAKQLLQSLVETYPSSISGWLSLIRLREGAGEFEEARAEAKRALVTNTRSEELWTESARLAPTADIKLQILEDALKVIPRSPRLWLRVAETAAQVANTPLEAINTRLRRLKDGLLLIPDALELWRATIEASRVLDAAYTNAEHISSETLMLLENATNALPAIPEFWIGLAELQETQQATRMVLNKARVAAPLSHEIWIASACIEEVKYGNAVIVPTLLGRMLASLHGRGHVLSQERWLQTAIECEISKATITARKVIELTWTSESSTKGEILEQVEHTSSRGHVATGRALLEILLRHPDHQMDEDIWIFAIRWEQRYVLPAANHEISSSKNGTILSGDACTENESSPGGATCLDLDSMLARAIAAIPQSECFWLMAAKDFWKNGAVDSARSLLKQGATYCVDSEELWIAAAKIERWEREVAKARNILYQGRTALPASFRLWIKSAQLERAVGNLSQAISLLVEATESKSVEKDPRLWLMLAETIELKTEITPCEKEKLLSQAKKVLVDGVRLFPSSPALWMASGSFEERFSMPLKARAIYEHGRIALPHSDTLWMASIRFEESLGNKALAKALLAKGLQAMPTSGLLWSEAIRLESPAARKTRAADALRRCPEDARVALALARVFWEENLIPEKIQIWIERAVALDPLFGDAHVYAALYEHRIASLEASLSNSDLMKNFSSGNASRRCCEAEPKYGELWISISKNPRLNRGLKPLSTLQILELAIEKLDEQLKLPAISKPN